MSLITESVGNNWALRIPLPASYPDCAFNLTWPLVSSGQIVNSSYRRIEQRQFYRPCTDDLLSNRSVPMWLGLMTRFMALAFPERPYNFVRAVGFDDTLSNQSEFGQILHNISDLTVPYMFATHRRLELSPNYMGSIFYTQMLVMFHEDIFHDQPSLDLRELLNEAVAVPLLFVMGIQRASRLFILIHGRRTAAAAHRLHNLYFTLFGHILFLQIRAHVIRLFNRIVEDPTNDRLRTFEDLVRLLESGSVRYGALSQFYLNLLYNNSRHPQFKRIGQTRATNPPVTSSQSQDSIVALVADPSQRMVTVCSSVYAVHVKTSFCGIKFIELPELGLGTMLSYTNLDARDQPAFTAAHRQLISKELHRMGRLRYLTAQECEDRAARSRRAQQTDADSLVRGGHNWVPGDSSSQPQLNIHQVSGVFSLFLIFLTLSVVSFCAERVVQCNLFSLFTCICRRTLC